AGNLKFEQRIPHSLIEKAEVLRREWGASRPVWIAASTHEGEDELVLNVFRQVRRQLPDCLLVLVPRHPERFEAVAGLCHQRGYSVVLRSQRIPCNEDTAVFIGDSMGELPLFYAAADVAFVGGSLVHTGGHNLLEPAALGIPVVTGPNVFNFTEICDQLVAADACRKVESTAELGETVIRWLLDANERHRIGENGRKAVEQNRGALETVLSIIEKYL
ncbi:MAG: glycosyltransferase, partial [Gammaproteobacteria bacterium]|nr:glycosyltransferase [Gammaproteobacteria bacterium]